MHAKQHVEQLATLMLVKYEKETTAAAAAIRKVPPNISPSAHTLSIVAYSLTLKMMTQTFLKIILHFSLGKRGYT